MSETQQSVAIVGGGVIGLSLANELLDHVPPMRHVAIDVFSPQPQDQTTSATAAAFWAPYWVGSYPRSWATETLRRLQAMAAEAVPGVHPIEFEEWLTDAGRIELESELDRDDQDAAYWWRDLPGIDFRIEPFERAFEKHVPPHGGVLFSHRARFRSVVARMSDYLDYLRERAEANGRVRFLARWVDDFSAITSAYDVVFNCTGWGAKALCEHDPATRQMKLLAGMVCRVDNEAIETATLLHRTPFHDTPLYVVPRRGSRSDVICGGTAIEIAETPDPRLPVQAPDPSQWNEIMRRCRNIESDLSASDARSDWCGLRPVRESVRVEVDPDRGNLIHCYGHGGSGLTLSWGSVRSAIALMPQT